MRLFPKDTPFRIRRREQSPLKTPGGWGGLFFEEGESGIPPVNEVVTFLCGHPLFGFEDDIFSAIGFFVDDKGIGFICSVEVCETKIIRPEFFLGHYCEAVEPIGVNSFHLSPL